MLKWNDLSPGQIFVNDSGKKFVLVEVVLDVYTGRSHVPHGYFYSLLCLDGGGHIYESSSYANLPDLVKAINKAGLLLEK